MRRTGGRLLAALLLAVAGIAAAALLAPRGAAAPQSSCSKDPAVAEACTETTPTETTPTETTPEPPPPPTTTTTTTTPTPPAVEPPPMPTVSVPGAGEATVEQPTGSVATPESTPQQQPKKRPNPAVPAPVRHLGPTKATPKLGAGAYVFPVYGPASYWDTYGDRTGTGWHHGDDIFAPFGAPVLAVADSTLFLVGWNEIGGNRLWLRDDAGNYFYYAHLAAFSTAAVDGGRVKAGTVLGFVGDTGDARGTPAHLHFEVHPAGMVALGYDAAVNPTQYLKAWQRRQRLHFTNSDLIFATVSGWSAVVAAPTAAPGAILLHSDDISSATSLDRGSVAKALAPPPVRRRPWALRQALAQRKKPKAQPLIKLSPSERRAAVQAEKLDQGASMPPGFPGMSIWDTLSQCEAGGDWTANTGNGFYGGLQFTRSTWLEHGGGAFAKFANFASREQQIAIAQRVLATQGWIAWPACSAKLGLR